MLRALAMLAILVANAHADSKILVVETKGAPSLPALASQITLHTGAAVATELAPDADPTTFAGTAAEHVSAGAATLVVWIAPVEHGYLVFVAGRSTGRALTELVRIDASVGAAEIERTVALKVAGLLDEIFLAPPKPIAAVLDVKVAPVTVRTHREWRLEATAQAAYETHERGLDGRVGGSIGLAWMRAPVSLAPSVGGYWQPSGTTERSSGRASIVEAGGVVAVEGAHVFGGFEVFARPRFVAGGLTARDASNDNRRGRVTVFAPYAGLEVGLRRVVSNVRFGVAAGGDVALIHRELVIDDATIVDLGRGRFHVGLTMTVSL